MTIFTTQSVVIKISIKFKLFKKFMDKAIKKVWKSIGINCYTKNINSVYNIPT